MDTRLYLPAALASLTAIVFPATSWAEHEIGYIERFALAADREKALGELVPGSEDYYFFHALHYQNTRNTAKLEEILQQWKKRFPAETKSRRIIENREALMTYEATPQKTLAYLRAWLGVTFNYQQEVRDKKPDLPVALDPQRIARGVFEADALKNDEPLQSFSQAALEQLVRGRANITMQQRKALLGKIERPDVPGLVDLIVEDLREKEGSEFGKFPIHRALLPEQLDALGKAIPPLIGYSPFVRAKLSKLAPSADIDITTDTAAREAWLDRVWDYVKTLPPVFNNIKAHVLYQRLDHDRRKGVYDAGRLLEYLKLPRPAEYMNPKWLDPLRGRQPFVDPNEDLSDTLPQGHPVGNDEPLVREIFHALFAQSAREHPNDLSEEMLAPYTDYVRDSWLKPVLAEALIVGGYGDAERWASLLSPAEFQKLKERVDVEFPATNAASFQPGDDVEFDVTVKNTPKLIVRIYELNTLNYFLTQQRQLNTDLNLDGLVANREQTHTFDTGPFRRTRQTFKFPELKGKRGAWIIEFIGGGRSSRALVRTGQWEVLAQRSGAGDSLLVLDEKGAPVKDAVVWLDGRKFTPDEKLGRIIVPYTAKPGRRAVVVADAVGSFATLTSFEHHAEDYQLDAQFHMEREQLLARREATLVVRTALRLGETQLDPALLTEPKLTVTSTTLDGIATTREIKDLKLVAGDLFQYHFSVPERLENIRATLTGKVEVLSAGGEKRGLIASREWSLNLIDRMEVTNDGHLAKFEGNYVYELLGKNGEPVAEQPILFTFQHEGFTRPQNATLKTDEKGRVFLGVLAGIRNIRAKSPNGRESGWELSQDARTWTTEWHARTGEAIRIPISDRLARLEKGTLAAEVSLLERQGGTFTANHLEKVEVADGFLVIKGLTPGDYSLRLRGEARDLTIKVTDGPEIEGWYRGNHRRLEANDGAPLQITGIETAPDVITIRLANASAFTRVHLAGSRFEPGQGLFTGLGGFARFGVGEATKAQRPNLFSAGRQIGDEYRYILDRRYAKAYPGNMLTRPGLLLNPWAVRDTGLQQLEQELSEQAKATGGDRDGERELQRRAQGETRFGLGWGGQPSEAPSVTNFDFLADSAPALYNLHPDKDGVVRIDRKALGDRQQIQVYAEDLTNAAWQSFALPEVPTKLADQRLIRNLDPAKPFTQKREVTVLTAGQTLTLADILTSELETYDTLGGLHSLLGTLSGDATLPQFAWVLNWPKMKDDEKRAKYSEFACHELNFFLARKDPGFFEKVIKPSLANKKDKTFMDDFLLGRELGAYLQPTAFARLNVVERALFAQRLRAEAANIFRGVREGWELLPPNPETMERLFETALRGRALDAEAMSAGGTLKGMKAQLATSSSIQFAAPAIPQNFGNKNGPGAFPVTPTTPATPSAEPQNRFGTNRIELWAEAAPQGGASVEGKPALRGMMAAKAREPLSQDKDNIAGSKRDAKPEPEVENFYKQTPELQKQVEDAKRRANEAGYDTARSQALWDVNTDWARPYRRFDTASQEARAQVRAYFRTLGVTKEWAENNYYHLRIAEQRGGLIPLSAFWRDYAKWVADGSKGAFVSPNIAEASHNFAEMMLALAVTDLPFDAPQHTNKTAGGQFTLTAGGPMIAYHKEVKPATPLAANAQQGQVLVSQSFFRANDRYRQEGNEKFEKYVTGEFLTGAVYGANVVVTNPTSAPAKAEVLLQIPQGALPVKGSKATDSRPVRLEAYSTKTFEYYFYFPATAGAKKFAHFPVNVAVGGSVVGAAKPFEFTVVSRLTEVDKASWDYISQEGTTAEVFAFLEHSNLSSLDLTRVAWRCQEAAFFKKLTAFLSTHHIWNEVIYRHALIHNDPAALREWLQHQDRFLSQCGWWLSTKLLLLDPIERRAYEHLEYSPLVNQRAHRLGNEARIANPAVLAEYQSLLNILAYKPTLEAMDNLSVTYHLFLQDRVEEALARFHTVEAKALPTQIQHDYFRCYADFYESNLTEARGIAAKYADYPIDRWKTLFADVTRQLDEIEGKAGAKPGEAGQPDREKQQAELAATEPTFDFKVEKQSIALTYKNLAEVTVNYYRMDPEFSFSSSPFVSEDASRFSVIKPTKSVTQALPKDKDTLAVALPGEFAKANVLVEIVAAGQRRAQAYHANTLKLTVTENYGRLEARDSGTGQPVAKAYVKVYARLKNGTVRFFKDGYTDLRGRFDYASLSGTGELPEAVLSSPDAAPANGLDYQMLKPAELGQVEKLALLILSETNGAATREMEPPRE